MITGNGGPAHPFPPLIITNGELTEDALKQLGATIAQTAFQGLSKLDVYACAVATGMLAAGKSAGSKKFEAEVFVAAERLLAASIASDTISRERSLEFDRMAAERTGFITEVHDLREKVKRLSKSKEVPVKRTIPRGKKSASETKDN